MANDSPAQSVESRHVSSGNEDEGFTIDYSLFDFTSQSDLTKRSLSNKKSPQVTCSTSTNPPAAKRQRSSYIQQPRVPTQQSIIEAPQLPMKSNDSILGSDSLKPSSIPVAQASSQTLGDENSDEDPMAELEAWLKTAET